MNITGQGNIRTLVLHVLSSPDTLDKHVQIGNSSTTFAYRMAAAISMGKPQKATVKEHSWDNSGS